ncbi:MAG TPA: hypothetical protein VMB26_10525, partial [Candidatus Binataceae bacterium]|nr:hypothetical protein [Candidatus Binataceae bacterium]
ILKFVHGDYAFIAFQCLNLAAVFWAMAAFVRVQSAWEDALCGLALRSAYRGGRRAISSRPSLAAYRA